MGKFLKKTKLAAWGLLGGLALAACGSDEEGIKHVPRNRTLILGLPQMRDYDSFNPFIVGTQSPGFDYLFEPLYFYNAYVEKDHVIPWIAERHEYNADYTEATIYIRKGVAWSDGRPWTAHDLKFTIDMLKAHAPELAFSTDMDTWVAEVEVPDSLTARFVLKAPNPRFVFSYFTYNFGNGIHIVPKH
ncbi:MAG: ABC transporter substrate-binding protein, partial [Gemmatimonadota bacterium]|nr:ABC transporter substrate-binding protein [Gemmatimonadota bacterium]